MWKCYRLSALIEKPKNGPLTLVLLHALANQAPKLADRRISDASSMLQCLKQQAARSALRQNFIPPSDRGLGIKLGAYANAGGQM